MEPYFVIVASFVALATMNFDAVAGFVVEALIAFAVDMMEVV